MPHQQAQYDLTHPPSQPLLIMPPTTGLRSWCERQSHGATAHKRTTTRGNEQHQRHHHAQHTTRTPDIHARAVTAQHPLQHSQPTLQMQRKALVIANAAGLVRWKGVQASTHDLTRTPRLPCFHAAPAAAFTPAQAGHGSLESSRSMTRDSIVRVRASAARRAPYECRHRHPTFTHNIPPPPHPPQPTQAQGSSSSNGDQH